MRVHCPGCGGALTIHDGVMPPSALLICCDECGRRYKIELLPKVVGRELDAKQA